MEVQALFRAVHPGPDGLNLPENVGVVAAAEGFFVQRVEGLRHIQTVQPDLVGVDLLVPEVPLIGPGLIPEHLPQPVRRQAELLLPGALVEPEEDAALVDVVQVALLRPEGADAAVGLHEMLAHGPDEVGIARVPGDAGQLQQAGQHTAVDVVPGDGLALPELLQVPGGALRGGLLHQPQHIGVDPAIVCHSCSNPSVWMCLQCSVMRPSPSAPEIRTFFRLTSSTLLR